jgi:hypothetical protein
MITEDIEISDDDLVLVKMVDESSNSNRKCGLWVRVKFADTDGTFIGNIERKESDFTMYGIGAQLELKDNSVKMKYEAGDTFCYSDNVTICACPGLCRNK